MKKKIQGIVCFVLMLALLVPNTAWALTLAPVEDSAEFLASAAEDAALAAEAVPDKEHPEYGTLVYFNSLTGNHETNESGSRFNPEYNLTELKLEGLDGRDSAGQDGRICHTLDWATDPRFVRIGGTWQYTDGRAITGTVTMLVDVLVAVNGTSYAARNGINGEKIESAVVPVCNTANAETNDKWQNDRMVQTDAKDLTSLGFYVPNGKGRAANVRVYVKTDESAKKQVTLVGINGTKETAELTEETYTIPASVGGAGVSVWSDGSKEYRPGETVQSDLLNTKTLTATFPAMTHEEYGKLVYYNNFSTSDYNKVEYNVTALNLSGVGAGTEAWLKAEGPDDNKRICRWVDANNPRFVQFDNFVYADGTPIDGNVTVVADFLVKNAESTDTSKSVAIDNDYKETVLGESILAVDAAHNTVWQNDIAMTALADNLKLMVFYVPNRAVRVTNIRVYAANDQKVVTLVNEATGTRETMVISGETCTVPTQVGGVGVSLWSDGTNTYEAGAPVNTADLADKTLTMIRPALEHEKYGKLVYFNTLTADDFNTAEYDLTALKLSGLWLDPKAGVVTEGGRLCRWLDVPQGSNSYRCVTLENLVYADGTPIEGTVTVVADLMVKNRADTDTTQSVAVYGDKETVLADNILVMDAAHDTVWQNDIVIQTSATGLTSLSYRMPNRGVRATNIRVYVNIPLEPKNTDEYSIRLGAVRGMRMTSFVSALQRGLADEYGFIVALADSFADNDYSTLMFPEDMKGNTALEEGKTGGAKLADGTKFVYATAYDKASGTDIHKVGTFGDEDGFLINAVIINISAENYRTQYVARPYLRVGDSYFYGEVMVKSIKDVAEVISLDDAYMESLSEEDWNYINDILSA